MLCVLNLADRTPMNLARRPRLERWPRGDECRYVCVCVEAFEMCVEWLFVYMCEASFSYESDSFRVVDE